MNIEITLGVTGPEKIDSAAYTDEDRATWRLEYRKAFNWVMREVVMDLADQEVVFETAFTNRHDFKRAVRMLIPVWPRSAQWSIGEEYLRSNIVDMDSGEVAIKDLLKLLVERIYQVEYRFERDEQIRELLSSSYAQTRFCGIIMNEFMDQEEIFCGREKGKVVTIEEGFALMEQPACAHPACRCSFEPYRTPR